MLNVAIENKIIENFYHNECKENSQIFSKYMSEALELFIENQKKEEYKKAMIEASQDELYIQDMNEVISDFKHIDNETIL